MLGTRRIPAGREEPHPAPLGLQLTHWKQPGELVHREAGISRENRLAIEASLTQAETLLKKEQEDHISELSMLRVLASAGTTVLVFDHTLRAMAGQLLDVADRLESIANYLPQDEQ